jgi:hypothetical protein
MNRFSRKCDIHNIKHPYTPPRPVTRITLFLLLFLHILRQVINKTWVLFQPTEPSSYIKISLRTTRHHNTSHSREDSRSNKRVYTSFAPAGTWEWRRWTRLFTSPLINPVTALGACGLPYRNSIPRRGKRFSLLRSFWSALEPALWIPGLLPQE